MGCCAKFAKFMLFGFNVIFWVAGGIALGIGIYLRVKDDVNEVVEFAGLSFYYAGCYIMISIGAFMFVVGFVGCCGAIKENRCLLGIYFFFILIVFIVELGLGIWALVNQDTIEADIQKSLNQSSPLVYNENDAFIQSVIATEQRLQCCGLVNGCSDWTGGKTYGCDCDPTSSGCDVSTTCGNQGTETGIYTETCYNAVNDIIMSNLNWIAGIGITIGLIELFGMIFVIILCKENKKNYETY